ncbi:MAG: hypothetical protein LBT32_01555 [Peptococcaceae bacterium]|nr:hypothetical protein [Peptococcaceae bacterium]
MPCFDIAGISLNADNQNLAVLSRMNGYLLPHTLKQTDIRFSFETRDYIPSPQGRMISDDHSSIQWMEKPLAQDGYFIYTCAQGARGEILALVDVQADWRSAHGVTLNVPEGFSQHGVEIENYIWSCMQILTGIVFRYGALHFQGVAIHASTIKWRDQGIAFCAPSGTGKSTQVKLWQKYKDDVTVLNDDNPIVRVIADQAMIFGTPWSGSAHINRNDSAPLTAIILLEQAETNSLARVAQEEAVFKFIPRVFLPYYNKTYLDLALNIVETVVRIVPVYALKCRPDQEAVELVYQCLK